MCIFIFDSQSGIYRRLSHTPSFLLPSSRPTQKSALQSFLQTNYPAMVTEGQPTVSALMWLLAKKHPDEFLEDPEDPNSVVRFTDLRKLALSVLAQKCELPEPHAVAEAAFQAWHDAR